MTKYKIFLTKSIDAAAMIAEGLRKEIEMSDDYSISHGAIISSSNDLIPRIYHEAGYYYATLIIRNHEEESYELTIC